MEKIKSNSSSSSDQPQSSIEEFNEYLATKFVNKKFYELPDNNFLFAIHYLNAMRNTNQVLSIDDFVGRLAYYFDLFTSVNNSEDNLKVFRDYKPHRYKKKFLTFQHLANTKIDRSDAVLVSFVNLLEFLIDNVQTEQLFQFLPQLCAAALETNINLDLFYNHKLYHLYFGNNFENYTDSFKAPTNTGEFKIYEDKIFYENDNRFNDRQHVTIAIYCSDDFKTFKYFAARPKINDPIEENNLIEKLKKQWEEYSQKSREERFDHLKNFCKLGPFSKLVYDEFQSTNQMFKKYNRSKLNKYILI